MNIENKTPLYITKISKIYENKNQSRFWDREWLLQLVTLGYRKKLVQAVLREIEQSKSVLQIGATFGNQIDEVSKKVGYYGNYDLVDVSLLQYEMCLDKYKGINHNMKFSNQNGLLKISDKYDAVISFMLLHELPKITRLKMINHLLDIVGEGGKMIIVDYHKPKNSVLKKFQLFFYRLYKPFVEEFWEENLQSLVKNEDKFIWHKYTMMNDSFQIIVADKINILMDKP